MSAGKFLLLIGIGIGGGLSASVAGLASLVSYPALLLLGLSPIAANVTNTIALTLNGVGAVAGSRPELAGQRARVIPLAIAAALGGALGSALLLLTPASSFEKVVPWLIGGASACILLPRRAAADGDAAKHAGLIAIAALAIAIYAGYFGAAAGVLMLVLLLHFGGDPLPRASALKNVALGAANGVAAIGFALFAPVDWAVALPLSLGFLAGGRVGPLLVRRLPARPLRIAIAIGGMGLALRLGYQAYR